jgi:hypothetical protein
LLNIWLKRHCLKLLERRVLNIGHVLRRHESRRPQLTRRRLQRRPTNGAKGRESPRHTSRWASSPCALRHWRWSTKWRPNMTHGKHTWRRWALRRS